MTGFEKKCNIGWKQGKRAILACNIFSKPYFLKWVAAEIKCRFRICPGKAKRKLLILFTFLATRWLVFFQQLISLVKCNRSDQQKQINGKLKVTYRMEENMLSLSSVNGNFSRLVQHLPEIVFQKHRKYVLTDFGSMFLV